jgi:hypothetical protein
MGVGKQMQLTNAVTTFANQRLTFLLTLQLIGGPRDCDGTALYLSVFLGVEEQEIAINRNALRRARHSRVLLVLVLVSLAHTTDREVCRS